MATSSIAPFTGAPLTGGVARRGAAVCLLSLLPACAANKEAPIEQKGFTSPEAAVKALVWAAQGENLAELEAILGPESKEILDSGDPAADKAARKLFLDKFKERNRLARDGDTVTLHVGELDWPFPVPLVKEGEEWFFDTTQGKDEILDRRIGRNELHAIQVCLACVDAERQYAREDRDGDGFLEYAGKFASTPKKRDGLFWPVNEGEEPSPLGPLVAEATREGYSRDKSSSQGTPQAYHGYIYRILKGQGPHAPGGAYDYEVRDHLIGGIAFLAYPASYGVSGIKTFITSHDGVVYEKDLGEATEAAAEAQALFDPDTSWSKVEP